MQAKETIIIQGRETTPDDISFVKRMISNNPKWSRWRLSIELSKEWNWYTTKGQLKDMACRSFLLKLDQRGYIKLPARKRKAPVRMNGNGIQPVLHDMSPINHKLKDIMPIEVIPLFLNTDYQVLFDFFLNKYHYLSYRGSVGENIKYLIFDCFHRPLACVLFGSSAWKVESRDRFIGWDKEIRERNINLITNNMRFLILPWVSVKYLASHLLGDISRRIMIDWQKKYGHPVYLLETFVERDRFKGSCYKASNWIFVGETKGRSRNDRYSKLKVPVKDVYLFPLSKDFREKLKEINI